MCQRLSGSAYLRAHAWHLVHLVALQPDDAGGAEDCVYASASGCLSDGLCNATNKSNNLPLAACCEVPSYAAPGVPCTSCPSGFSNADASGFCYKGITSTLSWDDASTACRALDNSASLAVAYDAVTATSIYNNACGSQLSGSTYWIGMRNNIPNAPGHTNPAGTYWRWMGAGAVSTWFIESGTSYWNSGEREFAATWADATFESASVRGITAPAALLTVCCASRCFSPCVRRRSITTLQPTTQEASKTVLKFTQRVVSMTSRATVI